MKLNLGCGKDIKEGYINLDLKDLDLNVFPYHYNNKKIKDDTVDEILFYRVIDHLNEPDLILLELKRILKPKGRLKLIVSHKSRSDAFNLRHKFQTNYNSLIEQFKQLGFKIIYSRIIFSRVYKIFEPIFNKFKKIYEFSFLESLIPAMEIKVILTK